MASHCLKRSQKGRIPKISREMRKGNENIGIFLVILINVVSRNAGNDLRPMFFSSEIRFLETTSDGRDEERREQHLFCYH
jgi:hypothetical protein